MQAATVPTNSAEPILLKPSAAAELLRVCPKTLYLAERKKQLRSVRLGRSLRYRRSDLEAWVQSKLTPEVQR